MDSKIDKEKLINMSQAELDEALLKAIKEKNLEDVKFWCKNHANILTTSDSCLARAYDVKAYDIFYYLVENAPKLPEHDVVFSIKSMANNEDFKEIDKFLDKVGKKPEMPPYFFANLAEEGKLNILKYFHAKAFNLKGNDEGCWLLTSAVKGGQTDIVKFLIEEVQISADEPKTTAALSAALVGNLEIFEYLHKAGADILATDNIALFHAVEKGHLDIVKYIISTGVDIDINGKEGAFLLASSILAPKDDVFFYLSHEVEINSPEAYNTALYKAIVTGKKSYIPYILSQNIDINSNYFMAYLKERDNSVVEDLRHNIFMVGVLYEDPSTLLGIATITEHFDIALELLKADTDIKTGNFDVFKQLEQGNSGFLQIKNKNRDNFINELLKNLEDIIDENTNPSVFQILFDETNASDMEKYINPKTISKDKVNIILKKAVEISKWKFVHKILKDYNCDIDDDFIMQKAVLFEKTDILTMLINRGASKEKLRELSPKLLFDITEKPKIKAELKRKKLEKKKQKKVKKEQELKKYTSFRKHIPRRRF